jgi:glycosyltransferase involved in cell wall biosynthesis
VAGRQWISLVAVRILLAVPSLEPAFGGPVGKARALAAALRRLGHCVKLTGAGHASGDDEAGLPVVTRFHGTPIPLAVGRVVRAVREAEVTHVIGYRDPVGAAAALAARGFHLTYLLEPVGMHRRRIRSVRLKWIYDTTLGRVVVGGASLVVATSQLEARELQEDGVPPARVAVRPNGIDLAALGRLPPRGGFRTRLGLDGASPLVLSLGRIASKKGLPLLLEAVARIANAHVAIVGPDDRDGTVPAVAQAAARLGVERRVHLMSAGVWGKERLEALVDADVFCLFSQTENFGIAPAEAAACGTATIVSDQCGVAEWLGDGVEVVPYGDVPRLAATIENLLRDPARRRALAERGRAAARKLSWDAIARQQVELYERVLRST